LKVVSGVEAQDFDLKVGSTGIAGLGFKSFQGEGYKKCLLDIGMEPRSTPVRSPQSIGMAEVFIKIVKRYSVSVNPVPDAQTVVDRLPDWFEHYNALHPHKALGYRSPREFIADQTKP